MPDLTLKKLSELTGVSIRSVNRALHGDKGLGSDKRKMVLELARKLGYTPNVAARNLRLKKSNFIGFVIPLSGKSEYNNYTASSKVNRIQLRLEKEGFSSLQGISTGNEEQLANLLRQWSGLTDTIIFFTWPGGKMLLETVKTMFRQTIFVDIPSPAGHELMIDRSTGIVEGIRCLVENGHSHIARCGSVPTRVAGFERAIKEIGDKKFSLKHIPANNNFQDGYSIGEKIIKGRFDSIFFDTDRMAFGFLKYCFQHGIRVPEDIAVIGFDDEPWDLNSCPSLSTVAHPSAELTDAVSELVCHPHKDPVKLNFPTRFIRRESV